jgi:tol-pal system protein YbgF
MVSAGGTCFNSERGKRGSIAGLRAHNMTVGRGLWGGAALLLVASGCGAGARSGERCATSGRAAEMAVQLRHDRHKIRDLENEVALLRAQLRERPVGLGEPPAPATEKAGEKAPEAAASAPAGDPLPPDVAASLYGDVEIVYEGDAAVQSKVRPRIQLHESSRSDQGLAAADPAEGEAPLAALPSVGAERLPVTRGRIPTVDEQLRSARSSNAPRAPGGAAPVAASAAPDPGAQPAITDAAPSNPAPVLRGDPVAEYRRYVGAFEKGNHDYAVAGLRAFLGRFADHYLADNVQYFVAESYFQRKLYRVAIGEYQKLVERYWRGNKLPDALLKIGLCHLSLGKTDEARAALRKVVARFPRTRPGKLARARLQELDRK